jgi:serralysin
LAIINVDLLETPINTKNYWIDSLVSRTTDSFNLNYLTLNGLQIKYTFILPEDPVDVFSLYNIEDLINYDSLGSINSNQESALREALNYISEITGIKFTESSSDNADWFFMNGEVFDYLAYSSYGYRYYDNASREIYSIQYKGSVVFDDINSSGNSDPSKGSSGYELILHELGHLLGLKHPFEGRVQLDSQLENTNFTLMSYTNGGPYFTETGLGPYRTEYSEFDIAALNFLYGGDGLGGEKGYLSSINIITGTSFSDIIYGTNGTDQAIINEDFIDISLVKSGAFWNISSGTEEDILSNIERLEFNDKHIALDLDGNAGKTIKLLGALLGKEEAVNKAYVGAGLKLLDDGMTYEELMQVGLDVVLGANPSSSSVVDLIWTNIVGPPTAADNLPQYSVLIDNGTYTAAELAIAAADHSLNTTNIDFIGLSQTGVEYLPYG